MKKWIAFCLVLLLPLGMLGCTDDEVSEDSLLFYYPNAEISLFSEDGVIRPEIHAPDNSMQTPQTILNQYLEGPTDNSFRNPFPEGSRVLSSRVMKKNLGLIMNAPFGILRDLDLTIACTCLAKTALRLFPEADSVRISIAGDEIGGKHWMDFSPSDLILIDDSVDRLRDSLILYLTDDSFENLLEQPVTINLTSGNSTCNELMENLLTFYKRDRFSPVPDGTVSLGVTVNDGICAVNLSHEFLDNIYTSPTAQYLTLQGITNTLTQLNYVQGVNFYCEGIRLSHYGAMNTEEPWVWDSRSVLVPSESGKNRTVSLCLPTTTDSQLVPLKVPLKEDSPMSDADQILHKLLHYKPCNGFINPIPFGSRVISVENADGVYTVSMSNDFLSDVQTTEIAVRTMIASISSLPDAEEVRVRVEGKIPPEYQFLFSDYAMAADWFA